MAKLKSQLAQLDDSIAELNKVSIESELTIRDHFDSMRQQVDIVRETAIENLHKTSNALIIEIDAYERECMSAWTTVRHSTEVIVKEMSKRMRAFLAEQRAFLQRVQEYDDDEDESDDEEEEEVGYSKQRIQARHLDTGLSKAFILYVPEKKNRIARIMADEDHVVALSYVSSEPKAPVQWFVSVFDLKAIYKKSGDDGSGEMDASGGKRKCEFFLAERLFHLPTESAWWPSAVLMLDGWLVLVRQRGPAKRDAHRVGQQQVDRHLFVRLEHQIDST